MKDRSSSSLQGDGPGNIRHFLLARAAQSATLPGVHTTSSRSARRLAARPRDGVALLDFLACQLGLSRRQAKSLLDARCVFVNGRRIWMARHRLAAGDAVEVAVAPAPARRAARPLYEDDDYLIIDKPPGLASTGPRSAESVWRTETNNPALCAVHRLDRDTSGCLLLARTPEAAARMHPLFARRHILKVYHALVSGQVRERTREIAYPVDHQSARTRMLTLAAAPHASHLQLTLETGRTHQIRRHLLAIGHPLLGDRVYATRRVLAPAERTVSRHMLHAARLAFAHPADGRPVEARAPLPPDFLHVKRRFGLA